MRRTPRAFAWLAILGLVIALAVILQQRGDAPPEELADGASLPFVDANTSQQLAATAAREPGRAAASASITVFNDEADSVCTKVLNDLTEFAETELNASGPLQSQGVSEDELLAELEDLPRRLAGSPDPETFLTAVLLDRPEGRVSDDPSASATLLELGVRAASSDSPLLAWHALRACVTAREYCPFPELEQNLLEAQQDNADAWALAATLRYRRGDVAGALAAMQNAGLSSTSTWYWTETTAMIERSLAEQIAVPFAYRAGNAFGVAAAALPLDASTQMCREQSATSRAWAEACLAFGNLRGERNETMAAQGLAYSLRAQALTALGDTEGAAAVATERALFDAERALGRSRLSLLMNTLRSTLATADPERFQTWLSAIEEFGETDGARVFLRQELPPFMQRAGLLEREGAPECVAQFFEPPVAIGIRSATYRDYPIEEYPIRIGDQLQIAANGNGLLSGSFRVGSDGMITLPPGSKVAAAGKTTGQLGRDIVAAYSDLRFGRPSEVLVMLMSSPSPEELRLEFDNALREAAARREDTR